MVDLIEEYRAHGFEPVSHELPDYLPLFLEFLSLCAADEARRLLDDAVHVVAHIGRQLAPRAARPTPACCKPLATLASVEPQPLSVPPVRDMDEALETFGPGPDGVEPCSNRRCPSWRRSIFTPAARTPDGRQEETPWIPASISVRDLPVHRAQRLLLGSLIRFEREQYSWKSESSQLLHRGSLRLGSMLFHIGVLGLFLATPSACSPRWRCGTRWACRTASNKCSP